MKILFIHSEDIYRFFWLCNLVRTLNVKTLLSFLFFCLHLVFKVKSFSHLRYILTNYTHKIKPINAMSNLYKLCLSMVFATYKCEKIYPKGGCEYHSSDIFMKKKIVINLTYHSKTSVKKFMSLKWFQLEAKTCPSKAEVCRKKLIISNKTN